MSIPRQTRAALYLVCQCPIIGISDSNLHHSTSSLSSTIPDSSHELKSAILWELVRLFDSRQPKSEAVLSYLAKQEPREVNPHLQDDIRIAWLTVLHAAAGQCDAWGYSFWQFFGKTYPKALKAWAERDEINREALERCAQLVREQQAVRLTVPEGKSEGHKNESRLPLYESCKQVLAQKKPRAA